MVCPRGSENLAISLHLQGKKNLEVAWERSKVRAPRRLFAPYAHRSLRWETSCAARSAVREPLLRVTAVSFVRVLLNVKYASFPSRLPTQRKHLAVAEKVLKETSLYFEALR